MKVVDQNIPAGLVDQYGHSLQPATLWKAGTGIHIVNKRKPFQLPNVRNQPYGSPSIDQLEVREAFSKCVDCYNKSPRTGGVTPPTPGYRSRAWWYNAAAGSGLWYFDYFIQQSWATFFAGNTPDWCVPFQEIILDSKNNSGYVYTHHGPTKTYRIESTSPVGLPQDDYWPDYVWCNWGYPYGSNEYFKGGDISLLINKPIHWSGGTGGGIIDNEDAYYPMCKGPDGDQHAGRKIAADCARGNYNNATLNDGEFFIIVCKDARDWYGDNIGEIHFKIY